MKDYIINNIPVIYKEFIDEFIKIDNRFYERRIERGEWAGNYSPLIYQRRGNTQRSINHYGDPIDLDII